MKTLIFAALLGVTLAQVRYSPSMYKNGIKWELGYEGPSLKPDISFFQRSVQQPQQQRASFQQPFRAHQKFQPLNYEEYAGSAAAPASEVVDYPSQYLPPQNYGYQYSKPVYKYDY